MTRFVWSSIVTVLGLSVAGCGGGGGGSGNSFFIEQCSLGCTNGLGGSQVSCGIINTFQNQEIGVLFSEPVDLGSVNDQSFQIVDVSNGLFPAGSFLLDPHNRNRVIFRPLLDFDNTGNPIFGFQANRSYQIRLAGAKQGDLPPYVQSTEGSRNQSRLLCTITTDQGITDPVPGPPTSTVVVDTLTADNQPAQGATDVKTSSTIRFTFNDLMDIGTLVIGNTSPFITVSVDPDGNVLDPTDQVPLAGTFSYTLDQDLLTTTVIFTPSSGMPSKGAGPNPRLVVVNLATQIQDLAGNHLSNPGDIVFTPQLINYSQQTLPPPSGELFTTQANRDTLRTGADWGVASSGRLVAATGGGSGRLGDLVIKAGQTVTLHTSAIRATGSFTCSANPKDGDELQIGASALGPFQWVTGVATGTPLFPGPGTAIQNHAPFTSYSLTELVDFLNASADPDVSQASYKLLDGNQVVLTFKTPGATGNALAFAITPSSAAQNVFTVSGATLSGGVDSDVFAHGNLLDNFDFNANPGGTPADITVTNGVYEFDTLRIDPSGVLRFVGTNPARLLIRGQASIKGLIDVSGISPGAHASDSPLGQVGGLGGPGGGKGGNGGDRRDYTGVTSLLNLPNGGGILSAAVQNPGANIVGGAGVGVGGTNLLAAGPGGQQWPTLFPSTQTQLNNLATDFFCESDQVGGAGAGGGYAIDGKPGVPQASVGSSSQGTSNIPANTPGGDASVLGLEPPGNPPVIRKLTPKKGYLRGGAGGGGAGANLSQTNTDGSGTGDACIGSGASITIFRDHSGAGGGGAGGAVQVQVGDLCDLQGLIDARGGDGGSAKPASSAINSTAASPGGGGSGGAVLLQAKTLQMSASGAPRIDLAGGFGGVDNTGSVGGDGAEGLLRLEAKNTLDLNQIYTLLNPIDPPPASNYNTFATTGVWSLERTYPDSLSGAQSCWCRATGVQYFQLTFVQDSGTTLGWDMDILWKNGPNTVTISYRQPSALAPFNGLSPEAYWGTNFKPDLPIGGTPAPLAVRFQGVRTSKPISDLCTVDITDPTSGIVQGTLTPWVSEPIQLAGFPTPPDMLRFAVIFDGSHSDFTKIVGVTNLRVFVKPD